MIRVFYSNDPLAQDQGGGAEHFRGIYRALSASSLEWRLVAARLQDRLHPNVEYISATSHFGRWYLALWLWFWRNRRRIGENDVLHFHRNYAAWPKYLCCPNRGRVVITYHNVSGRVLAGILGRLATPLRAAMTTLERMAVSRADRVICVSDRDRAELARRIDRRPFERAAVLAAAFDVGSMAVTPTVPVTECRRLLLLGRLEHQKNPVLAIEVLERLVAEDDRGWSLTIAGAGRLHDDVRRRCTISPVRERIELAGLVPHDQVAALLDRHDLLLLTSRYEASPTVVKEALLRHRPVVATDVGDVARWLDEGSGTICAQNPAALARGVRRMADLCGHRAYRPTTRLGPDAERRLMAPLLDLYRAVQAGA